MTTSNTPKQLSDRQRTMAADSVKGAFWAFIAKYAGKLVNLAMVTVLARVLSQNDFGVAAYALVVVGFLEVTGLGIGPALVYHDADDRGKSTGFWLALVIGLALFGLSWVAAPLVGAYFEDDRAIDVVRVLALSFPIIGLGAVPEALLLRSLQFRRAFMPAVVMALFKALTAIVLAFAGFGAWSLIIAQVVGALAQLVMFWVANDDPWRPRLEFDRSVARKLGTFGLNIAGIEFLGAWLLNVDYLLVGRYLGAAALGVYLIAFRIPELAIKELYGVLSRSLFPIFTRMKDQKDALASAFTRTNRYVGALTIPMGVGMWLVAEPMVLVVFGDGWREATTVIGPIAIYTMLRSLYFNAGSIYKSTGRPGLLTRLNVGHAVVLSPALFLAATRFGTLEAIAWTHVVVTALVAVVQLGIAARVVGFRPFALVEALWAPVVAAAVMAPVVLLVLESVDVGPAVRLFAGCMAGVAAYLPVLWLLQRSTFAEIRQIMGAATRKS